nr:HEPN domain-containing protein [Thiomonas sp.]
MNADDLMAKTAQAAESARALLERGDADGACNRAYYAIFDAARAALLAAGHDVGKTHRGVLNRLQRPTLVKDGPMSKEAGRLLKHAEAFRYVADYSDNAVDLTDASELVRQAETFVATVRSMLAHSEPGTGGVIPAGRARPRSTRC